jgi:hypothetical protein
LVTKKRESVFSITLLWLSPVIGKPDTVLPALLLVLNTPQARHKVFGKIQI